jgi:hypothetical protein
MSKSNKYGYSGVDIPTQEFGANVGKLEPSEINELVANDQWTQYGQLQLIETKTGSGDATIDFSDLRTNLYNVHFVTIDATMSDASSIQIRFFENGVLETSSVYDTAYQNATATGSFSPSQSGSNTRLFGTRTGGAGEIRQAYNYLYNLGDSTQYSFHTMHGVSRTTGTTALDMRFGSGLLAQRSTVDGLRFFSTGGGLITGKISLYGIRYS